jgi:predicted ATP-grasp superfamily ATP-dependent carboligase
VLNDQSNIEAQVKTATNASGSAPIYSCRAWCNFNGAGTVAIRASGNVSSITDLGTGNYQINFTTAMPDANYVVNVNGRCSTGTVGVLVANANSVAANATGSSQIAVGTSNDSGFDADFIFVSIFR